jgi:hypothetical protein
MTTLKIYTGTSYNNFMVEVSDNTVLTTMGVKKANKVGNLNVYTAT